MANRYGEKRYFRCLHCNKEKRWSNQSTNKYCDYTCQWEYRYRTVTVPKIQSGKFSLRSGRDSVVRFLTERDGYKCATIGCNIDTWFGEKISLDIDHIDGNNENNYPSNWRFLCPNCHRMTPTWGNKKRI